MNAFEIIKKPVLSEKSYAGIASKKYVFVVDSRADKTQIKNAVEAAFGVKVAKVNTSLVYPSDAVDEDDRGVHCGAGTTQKNNT